MIPLWHKGLINNVILAPSPNNPFLAAVLELSTRFIEDRRFSDLLPMQSVTAVAGPDVFNAIWTAAIPHDERREWSRSEVMAVVPAGFVTDGVRDALSRFAMPPARSLRRWLGGVYPGYHQSDRHWLRWGGSIYND